MGQGLEKGLAEEFHPEVGLEWTSSQELRTVVSCWKEVPVSLWITAIGCVGQGIAGRPQSCQKHPSDRGLVPLTYKPLSRRPFSSIPLDGGHTSGIQNQSEVP